MKQHVRFGTASSKFDGLKCVANKTPNMDDKRCDPSLWDYYRAAGSSATDSIRQLGYHLKQSTKLCVVLMVTPVTLFVITCVWLVVGMADLVDRYIWQ